MAQQHNPLVASCSAMGKYTSVIILGLLTAFFTGIALQLWIDNKKLSDRIIAVIAFLLFSIMVTIALHNTFPILMCILFLLNIVACGFSLFSDKCAK